MIGLTVYQNHILSFGQSIYPELCYFQAQLCDSSRHELIADDISKYLRGSGLKMYWDRLLQNTGLPVDLLR